MSSFSSALAGLRIGFGMQTSRLWPKQTLILGGAVIDCDRGPEPFATGERDVVCQALTEALLSACGLPDLPVLFQDDPHVALAEPITQLSETAAALMRTKIHAILNVNVRVLCGGIALDPERSRIISILASAIHVEPQQIAVTFEPGAAFPDIQKGDAIVALAHVLILLGDKAPYVRTRLSFTSEMFSTDIDEEARKKLVIEAPGEPPPPRTGSDPRSEGLPERARQFERAVRSKLPPLPQAPPPRAGATLIVYTDGACRGNPGPSASGWVVLDEQGRLVGEGGSALGEGTNNQAEYKALSEAAAWIAAILGHEFILDLRLDSELVVKQISGEWKIKDPELRQLALLTLTELMNFMSFTAKHVPRAENSRADALANRALDGK